MIKTLRITTIVAAVLAVIFFVLPVVFGGRSNEEIEQFLNSAGVVEKYNKATDNKTKASQNETSPLITQAEAFAKYLNPPPKPKPSIPTTSKPTVSPPRPRSPITAKFTLVGTSFYASQPQLSLAFIDEPGKGLRWVRQGSQVGHIAIREVKDGLVVLQDGQRTFEIAAQQKPQRSLLAPAPAFRQKDAGASPVSSPVSSEVMSGTSSTSAVTTSHESDAATAIRTPPQISTEMMEEFLKSVQAEVKSGEIDSQKAKEILSGLGSMRISDDEAEKLKDLPKGLDTQQPTGRLTAEPNQIKERKVRRPARPRGLNRPQRKP